MNTLAADSRRMVRVPWAAWLLGLVLVLGAAAAFVAWASTPSSTVLSDTLSEPLNGATTAKIDINTGIGHLTLDPLTSGEQLLATGALQRLDTQNVPVQTLKVSDGQANLTLQAGNGELPWLRVPWVACAGAYEWQIHLNPTVPADIAAHSDGGNVKLNLSGLAVTRVMADTAGGNMDVTLPDKAANLSVSAKTGGGNVTVEVGSGATGSNTINANSGAGNVEVRVPSGLAARVHATSGLGNVMVDPRFSKLDSNTYQSPDYDGAANKVEITINSGAGNVSVNTK